MNLMAVALSTTWQFRYVEPAPGRIFQFDVGGFEILEYTHFKLST